ncbi:NAD(+) synthase [uncultured Helcococcus sp.]|uniref:NAD(+) synthase n=1 Tax=uncultured Helcococcus sp. TaxID=1072508 RepID=UPI00288C4E2A|nr:NAD(+) synthase [uncultured Helcococcus sp.]
MNRNFIRLAAANIETNILNIYKNYKQIKKCLEFSKEKNIDLLVFPELTFTGVSAGQMIASNEILSTSDKYLKDLLKFTKDIDTLIVLGLSYKHRNQTYNLGLAIKNGSILQAINKNKCNKANDLFFSKLEKDILENTDFPILKDGILSDYKNNVNIQIVFEDDLLSKDTNIDSTTNILAVLGSKATDYKKMSTLENDLANISKMTSTALVYAGPSSNESSSDSVFTGEKYIIENGTCVESSDSFNNGLIYNDINLDETNSFIGNKTNSLIYTSDFEFAQNNYQLKRKLSIHPYLNDIRNNPQILKNILDIQVHALARRLKQIPDNKIFLGLSGGLDSTLAFIVACKAMDKLNMDRKNIYAVTMPGLGTSDRTKNNALDLAKESGTNILTIDIKKSVLQHFEDINHDPSDLSVTFENAQARERTQILMDLSNKEGGIVLGTGNMSEIALGWSTYNADHMSMYNVNSGLPKTLLREVVRYVKDHSDNARISEVLADIIETPVSPELLPTNEDGTIKQETENTVGPYELHDFFIYHLIKNNSKIEDIYHMTINAFEDKYDKETILKWLKFFLRRFTSQQFKRNVAVDGPQILDYSLNPKYGFLMPSDIDIDALLSNL